MKKLLLPLAILLSSLTVHAAGPEISLLVPAGPTGSRALISNFLVPELNKKGWNIVVKSTGNCANANNIVQSSTEPVLVAWDNKELAIKNGPCARPIPTESELVGIWYTSPDFLCRVGNRPGITEATGTVRLSIQSYYQQPGADSELLNAVTSKSSATVRPVIYANSGAQATGAAANEFDYVLGTIGKKLEENNIAKCDYNTGSTEFEGTKPLKDAIGVDVQSHMVVYMFGQNFSNEQMKKLQKDYVEVTKTTEFVKYMEARKFQYGIAQQPVKDQIKFMRSSLGIKK
jgi:hypothetical protein